MSLELVSLELVSLEGAELLPVSPELVSTELESLEGALLLPVSLEPVSPDVPAPVPELSVLGDAVEAGSGAPVGAADPLLPLLAPVSIPAGASDGVVCVDGGGVCCDQYSPAAWEPPAPGERAWPDVRRAASLAILFSAIVALLRFLETVCARGRGAAREPLLWARPEPPPE